MILNRAEREHLAVLRRRLDWLQAKLAQYDREGKRGAFGWLTAEVEAIEWVFRLVNEIEDESEGREATG